MVGIYFLLKHQRKMRDPGSRDVGNLPGCFPVILTQKPDIYKAMTLLSGVLGKEEVSLESFGLRITTQ